MTKKEGAYPKRESDTNRLQTITTEVRYRLQEHYRKLDIDYKVY